MDTTIISNKVFKNIQPATVLNPTRTGKILYANKYADVAPVPLPEDIQAIFDSDIGIIGSNPLVQLKQKVQALPDGPWYVDERNGTLYIHNRKFNESTVHNYVYQAENGEVLKVEFQTQYITRTINNTQSPSLSPKEKEMKIDEKEVKTPNIYIYFNQPKESTGFADQQVKYLIRKKQRIGRYTKKTAFDRKAEAKASRTLAEEKSRQYKEGMKWLEKNGQADTPSETLRDMGVREITQLNTSKNGSLDKVFWRTAQYAYAKSNGNKAQFAKRLENICRSFFKGYKDFYYYNPNNEVTEWVDPARYNRNTHRFDGKPQTIIDHPTFNATIPDNPNGRRIMEGIGWMKYDQQHGVKITVLDDGKPQLVPAPGHTQAFPKYMWAVRVYRVGAIRTKLPRWKIVYEAFMNGLYGNSNSEANGKAAASLPNIADNKIKTITEKQLMINMVVVGNPFLQSSQIINILNVGQRWSGPYYIKTVTHELNPDSGYTCSMTLVQNKSMLKVKTKRKRLHNNDVVKGSDDGSTNKHRQSRSDRTQENTKSKPQITETKEKTYKNDTYSNTTEKKHKRNAKRR